MALKKMTGWLCTAFLVFAAAGCSDKDRKVPPAENITISRFECDLFSVSHYNLKDSIPYLEKKYPVFFPLFTNKIIEIGNPSDPDFASGLLAFTTDFTIYRVSQRVGELYADFSPYESEFAQAFGHYRSLFPGHSIPQIITFISGFNQSVITADSLLAVSLDKYLGPEDEFYLLLYPPVPDYLRRVMRPEKIVPDALQAWVVTESPYIPKSDNLLSRMIFQGRAVYCTRQLLPSVSDTLLWGFTGKQMNFCLTNEKRMWEYLVENRKLFVTDGFTIAQFVNEAPFTKDFSAESPGKAAVWLGYRITESFVKNNRDVSLPQLMEETDYQKILNLSRYNP